MSQEVYILKGQVHFGTLKVSVAKGTKLYLDRKNNKVTINGAEHDNISEVEMCIRAGFIIPFEEGKTNIDSTVKISPKAQENNQKKYEVEKSDVDNMSKDIDISDTKKEVRDENRKNAKMEVIRESENEESRGLKVITSDVPQKEDVDEDKPFMQVVKADEGEIVAKIDTKKNRPKGVPENTLSVISSDKEAFDAINGEQGTVVKTIGKSENTKEVSSGKKLTAKRGAAKSKDAEAKAKANAEARKKASEARRAKAAKEGK